MAAFARLSKATRENIVTYGLVIVAFIVMQTMISGRMLSNSLVGQMVPICSYIVMAVSLNLVVGISGELSLGHAGFMSVGAFSGVVVMAALAPAIPNPATRLVLTILVAGLFAALAGFLVGIPVMRLRGDYLAIVTLAFGEIIKNLLNNLYVGLDGSGLHFSMQSVTALGMKGGKILINGPQGATGISRASTFVIGFALVMFTLIVVLNLVNSRSGRAIMAVRDNRIAAESVGINTMKYRMMAFVVSAALAGMAGALYAMNFSTIAPKKFDFNLSIFVLVYVVLGGMGSIRGSVISATLLTILPEALRAIADYRMLIYAVVLIAVMLLSNNPTIRLWRDKLTGKLRRQEQAENLVAAVVADNDEEVVTPSESEEGGESHE